MFGQVMRAAPCPGVSLHVQLPAIYACCSPVLVLSLFSNVAEIIFQPVDSYIWDSAVRVELVIYEAHEAVVARQDKKQ